MRAFLASTLAVAASLTILTVPANAQFGATGTGGGGGGGATSNRIGGTSGVSNALSQTGQVLDASAFGGAGGGNMLRAATVGGMMGMGMGAGANFGMGGMGMNSFGRMGMGGMGMGGMGMGGMGMNQMGGMGSQPALKIPIRLGSNFKTPFSSATPVRASRFERRLTKLSGINTGAGVQVEVRAGVATITGAVPTDRDREMIEQMAMFEPGIDSVDNQLTVDSTLAPADDS